MNRKIIIIKEIEGNIYNNNGNNLEVIKKNNSNLLVFVLVLVLYSPSFGVKYPRTELKSKLTLIYQ
ncbi:MAG: hypothetical protein QOK89_07880, partial [Nitrososphaeraceae archaeon]|nr:hypothetical protein [Nitrososphaeraceae archaeon]